MSESQVKIIATFSINDYDSFVILSKETVDYCKQNEPDTVVYDWYVNSSKTEGRLVEAYANTEAFRRHVTGKIFTDIAPKMMKAIQWQSLEAYGELPSEFDHVMKAFPSVHWSTAIAAV